MMPNCRVAKRIREAGRGRLNPGPMPSHPSRAVVLASAFVPLALALSKPARSQTLPTLRVAVDPFDSYSEAYYAQDLGMFKKAGLDVQLQTFTNGAAITSAMAGGDADIGISNPIQLAAAFAHGLPFTLVAGGGMYSTKAPTTLMCVAANSPIQSAKDLNGKTIAVGSLKDITQLAARDWLVQNGATISTVSFIELPYPEMGPAVQRGTVAAVVLVEPALTAAEGRGEIRILSKVFDTIAPEFLIGVYFTTTSFLQKSPDLVRRFAATIYEAGRWANKNQSLSADIVAKYSKMTPETTHKMRRVIYAGELTPRLVQPELDVAFKSGIIDKAVSASDMIARL
jgi:NitT/TauT family transport system substrate-binding protein